MANIKISDLTAAAAASGTQEFEVNDSLTSKKVTGAQVLSYVQANTTPASIGAVSTADTIAVAKGGTGATTAPNARSNLGTDDASNLTTGTVGTARLASGTANNTTYLRGDQTWATVTSLPGTQGQIFTSSGDFTVPSGITAVKVTVVGGGGGGGNATASANPAVGAGGGGGGVAIEYVTGLIPGELIAVTIGTGGAAITAGGTSSFGAFCSATGGAAGASTGTTATSAVGGNGGAGSGGSYNLAGDVGGSGIAAALGCAGGDVARASGPGGGAGGRLLLKGEIVLSASANGLARLYGGIGYINGKGGDSITASVNSAGNPGTGFGNGGAGGKRFTGSSLASGGTGGAGVVIVEY